MRPFLKYVLLVAVLIFSKVVISQSNSAVPDLTRKELQSARESVLISNRQLIIEAYLSVDNMPTMPPSGPRPQAVVYIKSVNKTPIPAGTVVDAIWIFSADKSWSAWLPETSSFPAYDTPDKIDRVVTGHPFATGTAVDVIVRLTYGEKVYFLKAPGVVVRGTQ